MPNDQPTSPVKQTPSVAGIADHQLHSIARMEALGRSAQEIARITGLSTRKVSTLVGAENPPPAYAKHRDHYRQAIMGAAINHHFWTIDQMDRIEKAFERALTSSDERLSVETAKYLRESIIPQPTKKHEVAVDHRVDAQLTTKVEGAMAHVSKIVEDLRGAVPTPDATFRTVEASAPNHPEPPGPNGNGSDPEGPTPLEGTPSADPSD